MPDLTVLAPPSQQPPVEPAGVAPHREQAVVSCALLGYWTEPDPGAAPSYRHRLGLHAELAYHGDTETASILISAHALGVMLESCSANAATGT
jgi:hypothetical protein